MRKIIRKKPHSAEFKFKVAIAAIKEEKTTAELCQEYGIVSSQIFKWKKELIENGQEIFKKDLSFKKEESNQVEKLHATIGRLKVENDFLAKFAGKSQ